MDNTKLTLRDVEHELFRRRTRDPLAHVYKPHDGQVEAHKCRAQTTLVLGGNRAGKSWFAVAEALLYCLERSVYAEMPGHGKPIVVWYVMPSLTMFRRTIRPIFNQLAPSKEIRHIDEQNKIVYFNNGSELHFLSADMRQRRLQGATIDLAVMDETPNEDVFEELQARVIDRQGRLILVFAPVDAASFWVRDKLYIPWEIGERKDINVVFMPVADKAGNPLVPHLSKEDIEQMERQWPDPAVRAARIYGQFVTRSGLILKGFDPGIHMIESFEVPKEWTKWFICDPQYHRFAVLFWTAGPDGTYYITDEYFSQEDNLAHRAGRMAVIAGDPDVALPVYVDSANPQDIAELNWHFNRIGAPLGATQIPFQKRVDDMILRVHSMLEPDPDRKYPEILGEDYKDLYGAPRLFLFDRLMSDWTYNNRDMEVSRLLWEMKRYSWGRNGRPDKNSADGADCVDCLVYGCSIKAVTVQELETDVWKRGLTPADIMIWRAIDIHDRRRSTWSQREY